MRPGDLPGADGDTGDVVAAATRTLMFVAAIGSGWVVRNTVVPDALRFVVTAALVVAPLVAVVSVLHALGIELTGGQCRAATNDGTRCSLSRPANTDFCHVHRRHGGEFHDSEDVERELARRY